MSVNPIWKCLENLERAARRMVAVEDLMKSPGFEGRASNVPVMRDAGLDVSLDSAKSEFRFAARYYGEESIKCRTERHASGLAPPDTPEGNEEWDRWFRLGEKEIGGEFHDYRNCACGKTMTRVVKKS